MKKLNITILSLTLSALVFTISANANENKKDTLIMDTSKFQKTEEAVKKLDEMQEYVTQKGGTERAFQNKYWDHKEAGIYVDVVSREPLFASIDKFNSGTGWPSFTKPISDNFLTKHSDNKLGMSRVEVKSANADSHLGHVFDDGPADKGGKRYCINSAAMDFIPKDKLIESGYPEYTFLFEE